MNTVTIEGFSREACAIAVTQSHLDKLVDLGYLIRPEGDSTVLTEEGAAFVARLLAAGFEFNPGELEKVTTFLVKHGAKVFREGAERDARANH